MSKILIVEDEKVMSNVQKESFNRAGIDADVAGNGQEALKLLKKGTYDAIVTDIIMSRMDGLELLKALAGNQEWKQIPVIVLSNLSQNSDRQHCERLGVRAYLLKTQTSLDDLVAEVKKHLG